MHANSFGGTCNWPLKEGARLKEVAATAGETVTGNIQYVTNLSADSVLINVVIYKVRFTCHFMLQFSLHIVEMHRITCFEGILAGNVNTCVHSVER